MAHRFKIKPVPHKNKDGSLSTTKKDWQVWDRSRGRTRLVGVASSQQSAKEMLTEQRKAVLWDHLERHPKDEAFKNKHRINEVKIGEK